MRVRYLSALLLALCFTKASAQISVTGTTTATQPFTIGAGATASLPANWKMSAAGLGATANWADVTNVTATMFQASSGSPTDGGRYNWGDGTTDRAVGFMTTANYVSPNSIMAYYRNTSGQTFGGLKIAFEIERYRTNTSTFSLAFFTSLDGINWTPQTAGDIPTSFFATGNSAYDFSNPTSNSKSFVINNLSIPNNGDFYLKWVFTNTGSTNSMGVGLDDVAVTGVIENPNLPISCPYDFIFVLDESNSIAGTTGSGGSNISSVMRTAAKDLMSALNGTGTRVAVVEFRTTAARAVIGGSTAYQVVDAAYITAFNTYMGTANDAGSTQNTDRYDPEDGTNYTNWEAGFNLVNTINANDGIADLVIFLTDGNPTAYTNPDGNSTTQDVSDPVIIAQALLEATIAANTAKSAGSHIFAVAIPNPSVLEINLHQISGPGRYPDIDPNFISSDYSISSSQTLRDDLQSIAQSVCKVDLNLVKAGPQTACSGDQVVFTLVLTNNGLDNDANVVVTDVIPSGYTYVSDNGDAATTFSGSTLTWNVGNLAGGGVSTSLQITVTMNATGDYTNTASATGTQEDVDLANNTTSFTVNLALNCDDGDPCTRDFCEAGECVHENTCCQSSLECDDQNACTADTCVVGACQNNLLVCDDGDLCTTDLCGIDGCEYLPRVDSLSITCPADITVNSDVDLCQATVNYKVPVGISVCQTPCLDTWARRGGGTGGDIGRGIAVDQNGNVYASGLITGSATFGTTTLSGTGVDIFVVKYDALGNVKWAKNPSGGTDPSSGDYSDGIETDNEGNVYVIGWFDGTATFGATSLVSAGLNDLFIAKYDSSGNVLWAKNGGGGGLDRATCIDIQGDDIYVAGYFEGNVSIGGVALSGTSGESDIFVAKFKKDGSTVWVKGYAGAGKNEANGISVKGSKLHVSGFYSGTTYFGTDPGDTIAGFSGRDIFLVQLDTAGNTDWVRRAGTAGDESGIGVIADNSGNVYLTGNAFSGAVFNGTTFTGLAGGDIFLAKYNSSGTLLWVKGLGSAGADSGYDIQFSSTGKILVSASYTGPITAGATIPSGGNADVLIAKFDESGNFISGKRAGLTSSDIPFRMKAKDGLVYSVGRFGGNTTFDGTPLASVGGEDIYVWKTCETILTTTLVEGLGPGPFPEGVTTETYVVTNDEGDSATCSFTVTVEGNACDDQDACTTDACDDGACVHTPVVCDDNNSCTTDACVDGSCQFTPIVCNDQNACTNDACANGICEFVPNTVVADIQPAPAAICPGESLTLTASATGGSGNYTFEWNNGQTTATLNVSPTGTTTYTVTVTDSRGCEGTATKQVTVHPVPVAAIAPATVAICPGESVTLTASGGGTYLWSTNAATATLTVSPASTTTYTVTVTSAEGCIATASRMVTVNSVPVAAITPVDAAVCPGGSITLTASGGGTYLWSTNATTASINVSPTATTIYTVTVTNDQRCTASASRTVSVNQLPNAAIAPATVAICAGNSATLTASGGSSYLWSTAETTAVITVSPANTTSYSVTVSNGAGCNATVSRTVTVNPLPNAVITPAPLQVCSGENFTLTASGGATYLWNTTATTPNLSTSITVPTTYRVTVTDVNTCSDTASVSVSLISCNDNDLCTSDACVNSACVFTPIVCNDNNACTVDDCNPQTGCTTTPLVCNDGNACTIDACNPQTGCTTADVTCNDQNACTIDGCDPATGCSTTDVNCNDQNACTADACLPASGCVNSTIICNDQSACTVDDCNVQTGCVFTTIICDDGDACTVDNCNAQTGCTTSVLNCNDNNACTTDACDPQTGCVTTAIACNDNNACTNDICNPIIGCTHPVISCNDQNPCTTDGCNTVRGCVHGVTNCSDQNACTTDGCDIATGCTHTALSCIDNSLCTIDTCGPTQGCFYIPVDCNDSDPCTDDGCNAQTGCTNTPLPCADTDLCTTDKCIDGTCVHLPVVCNDGDPCTNDSCVLGDCEFVAIVCNDDDLCTDDFCLGGSCVFQPVSCDDQNACTEDLCEDDVCQNNDIQGCCLSDTECSDNDACTSDLCNGFRCYHVAMCCNDDNSCTYDFCLNGICVMSPIFCDDGDLCTENLCIDGICTHPQIDCEDGDLCTLDSCITNGVCTHTPLNCNDQNACTIDFCDANGVCQHLPVVCDDLNLCTADTCIQGECITTQIVCNDLNLCTEDFCIEGACVYLPVSCEDNDVCTNDICDDGDCTHAPVDCNDNDFCTTDACGPLGCFYTLVSCDDNDLCTIDQCVNGECVHTPQECNDGNACTFNICVDGACSYPPVPCDDGIECTEDVCVGGQCTSTPGQIDVTIQKTDMSCGCLNTNQLCLLDFAGLPAGTILAEQYANYGIHISALANAPGKNAALVFNSHATGTPDPDLEVDFGNLMVIARDLVDTNPANGLVDKPNDNSTGGTITLLFDFPRTIESFAFVDEEEPGTFAFAYDAQDNLIAFLAVPAAGDATIQTLPFAATGVRKLVFAIDGSGAVTNIVFGDCCCDGAATATATGGTGPYNFAWSNGVTGSGISELCPDNYCVTVTDANGCFAVSCIDIVQGGNTCDDGDSCTVDACLENDCIHTPIPGCEVAQPCTAAITGYTLVYESTLGEIGPMTEGMVIDRDEYCRFNIRADYCGDQISSVKFVLNGSTFRIEQDVPYALAGDNPTGNYHVWIPNAGSYTLTATPYSGPSATGAAGTALTINFSVVDNTPQSNENCLAAPFVDCNGDVNGLAFIDACGVCAWGNTGVIPNSQCPCNAEVHIVVEELPALCQGSEVLLRAVTAGATSYAWSTGETASQIYGLPDAIYSVTTTDVVNCAAADTQTTPPASALLASYVILSENSVTLNVNKVFTGGVGVRAANGVITLENGTQVTTPGTFVRAANISLTGGSAATTQYPNAVNIPMPAFESNVTLGGALITVPANSAVTLNNAVYGGVLIDSNSTVTFTHAQIDIDSLITGKNVTIRFESECAKLRVRNRITLGENNSFNADTSAELRVYAEANVQIGSRSAVIADIHTLGLLSTGDGTAADFTTMIGFFVANHVAGGSYTSWQWSPSCACSSTGGPRGDAKMGGVEQLTELQQEDKVLVRTYPNPFSEQLNLEFTLPADSKVKLDIFASNGKKIATLFDGQVKAAELRKVEYKPTTLANGLVLYRLQTTEGVYYGKAVMVK